MFNLKAHKEIRNSPCLFLQLSGQFVEHFHRHLEFSPSRRLKRSFVKKEGGMFPSETALQLLLLLQLRGETQNAIALSKRCVIY